MSYRLTVPVCLFLWLFSSANTFSQVKGSFTLQQSSFTVGEPIMVRFAVKNESDQSIVFHEGGDYRGLLMHTRYSFRAFDKTGREYTTPGESMCFGGLGNDIELKPGTEFRSWILLNPYLDLLPPGNYTLQCERKLDGSLGEDSTKSAHAPVIKQTLQFEIKPYNKAKLLKALAKYEQIDSKDPGNYQTFWSGFPINWAYYDLSQKFKMDIPWGEDKEAVFFKRVKENLPTEWEDRYLFDYFVGKWLLGTQFTDQPHEYWFTVRNLSTQALATTLQDSELWVDEKKVENPYQVLLAGALEGKPKDKLPPGETLTLKVDLGKLPGFILGERTRILWKINGFDITFP